MEFQIQAALAQARRRKNIFTGLSIFWFFGILGSFSEESPSAEIIPAIFIIVALAICFAVLASSYRNALKRYPECAAYLAEPGPKSVEGLAAALGKKPRAVRGLFKAGLKAGLFPNHYLAADRRTILPVNMSPISGACAPGPASGALREIQCPNCGAAAKVAKGQTSECEYCGSPILG